MTRHPPTPFLLTLAGGIPFVGLAIAMAAFKAGNPGEYAWSAAGLLLYAAIILSFLGGIRWGTAMGSDGARASAVALSVLPALAGWVMALVGVFSDHSGLIFLGFAGLFGLQFFWDWRAVSSHHLPYWFRIERVIGTSAALIGLIIAAIVAR